MAPIDERIEREGREAPSVLLTKLHPPPARSQTVARDRLLERLRPEAGVKLTVVAAPAGCGKSTLLGAWWDVESARRPVGWVTLDEGDSDPVVCWAHVLAALREVCPALTMVSSPELVGAARIDDLVLPQLVNELTEQGDAALVLDDFHRLPPGPSREGIAWLAEHAPPSFQLVVSTRSEPALPLATLRAHGELLELRADELGFTTDEADALLNDRLGLGLPYEDVVELVERSEGWPAGLYLAALSLRGVEDRHGFVSRFDGRNRHVVDFLVDEVLEAHDPALQALMIRCSILERLCGPLCDAVLEQDGSRNLLAELSRANLFLLPLDDHGQWYRFHHLFAQLLRVELEHREPGTAVTLHRRAFVWHRDHGSIDEAVGHALDACAFEQAGELIATRWVEYANVSRFATVLAWLERLPGEVVNADPVLLHAKAWVLSLSARRDEAAQAMAAAERLEGIEEGPLADGATSVAAGLATLRAAMPWGDVGAGRENAIRATELERPESPLWATACWSRGTAHFFRGESEEAEPWFARAARVAPPAEQWIIAASAPAYQSFIAGERGDLDEQRRFAEEAAQLAREHGVEEIDGEVPIAVATSLAARGELEAARPLLEQGVDGLRGYGQPIDLAHGLIRQARVLRALGEEEAAAAVVAEARAIVDSCPDPGVLEEWVAALEKRSRARSPDPDTELSRRELAVLRALTGPLSERDIGRELYLSHNTVHSHTRSIYRKLDVSSRAAAVRRARELGLI